MVYCYAELQSYRQLTRLRASSLPGIEAGLASSFGSRRASILALGQGAWLIELGDTEDLDVTGISAVLLRVLDFLEARRQELFGFALLIADAEQGPPGPIAERMRELLRVAEQEEGLWCTPECAGLLADFLAFDRSAALYRVTGPNQSPETDLGPSGEPRPWIREALIARALDIVCDRLNTGESREILHLHGPPGVGKSALLREAARRLLSGNRDIPVLRSHTLFRRRSPLHPFLNSLSSSFLVTVPKHLFGVERAAWADVSRLLTWLLRAESGADDGLRPDRVIEDFVIGYRLCLTAWVRMAAEKHLPALFLCDDVDTYHPDARRIVAGLMGEFLGLADFVPIVSTTEETLPEELAGLKTKPLYVHPLGKRELRSLCEHFYPGLALPESLLRRLRRRSGGLYVSVVSYLQYLHRAGFIRFASERHEWLPVVQDDSSLPANPLSASWYLIRTLHEEAFMLLYAVSLAGGLLDRRAFMAFLAEAGFEQRSTEKTLSGLLMAGLVAEEDSLIPRFPVLRRKLEGELGVEGRELRNRFLSYMSGLWDAGKYPHAVLLFTFFTRNGRTDLALHVLPEIIRRKLDEGDIVGARAFCDPTRLEFAAEPTPSQREQFKALMATGKLRGSLLEGNKEAAESARSEVIETTRSACSPELVGEAWLELAKHSLSRGDSSVSLDEAKQALLIFQEQRQGRSVRAEAGEHVSYLWLGATMLADGKLSEAVEYIGLSERLCREAGDARGALMACSHLAVALFVNGRLTQCLAAIERGTTEARAAFRREAELFLLFLRARTEFLLGAHEEACVTLEACLCLARLYSIRKAMPVLEAWLGRGALYNGELDHGLRLLSAIEPSREALYFLAEGFFFSDALEEASVCLDRALALDVAFRFPGPETPSWSDGFASVEGRCFRLSRGDSFVRRSLSALRAFLLGLRGSTEEGIRELHKITRSERTVDEDPNGYWYNYIYSIILPESGGEDIDDKETVLSKAVKSLQERASRIDAPSERSSFLSRNTWNRRIMEEARERKLV
ncbi:MAG TPA: AAA family ATPase [Spirochaetia bacterium]|nr:AAA family ATPase [Spirochaetia bacterium]